MKRSSIWAVGILAVLAAVLVVAWIKGGTERMRWIEQPVTAPGAGG